MANLPNNPTYTTAAGVGGSNYANVTIAGATGSGLVYTAGTGVTGPVWTTTMAEPYYTKQPKVKITDTDIELDGLSLKDAMQSIRDELMIPTRLTRNRKLEEEFSELQAAAEHYYELEREFLEKKKMWATLKHTDK
jgi:hypothetical protein